MAASDYVPIFFKNRLHLAGRPQMPGARIYDLVPVRELPYGPAAPSLHQRPDRWQHPTTCQSSSKTACTWRGVHRCLEHAFMIWFRSANSHTGPQLHRCIRGRTDGSIRLRANLLQKPLALGGASTDAWSTHL